MNDTNFLFCAFLNHPSTQGMEKKYLSHRSARKISEYKRSLRSVSVSLAKMGRCPKGSRLTQNQLQMLDKIVLFTPASLFSCPCVSKSATYCRFKNMQDVIVRTKELAIFWIFSKKVFSYFFRSFLSFYIFWYSWLFFTTDAFESFRIRFDSEDISIATEAQRSVLSPRLHGGFRLPPKLTRDGLLLGHFEKNC